MPAEGLSVDYSVDFSHPAIGRQQLEHFSLDDRAFERDIARARTFGFLRDVEALWRAGLAKGGNLNNTVVMDDDRVLNQEGLRFPDEFVRHKVLDLIGDLALVGMPIEGHITACRAGHAPVATEVRATINSWSAAAANSTNIFVPSNTQASSSSRASNAIEPGSKRRVNS